MKIHVAILFVLISLTSIGQSKKELLTEVNNYKIQSIKNASFDVSQVELETAIEDYLDLYGFKKSKKPEDGLLFRKAVVTGRRLSKKAPKGSNKIETEKKYKRNGKEKKLTYETRSLTILSEMRIDIQSDNYQSISLDETFFPESRIQFLTLRGMMTVEQIYFNLKRHLYVKYNGDSIDIPQELTARIDGFNNVQKRKRKMLVKGKDY